MGDDLYAVGLHQGMNESEVEEALKPTPLYKRKIIVLWGKIWLCLSNAILPKFLIMWGIMMCLSSKSKFSILFHLTDIILMHWTNLIINSNVFVFYKSSFIFSLINNNLLSPLKLLNIFHLINIPFQNSFYFRNPRFLTNLKYLLLQIQLPLSIRKRIQT